VKRVSEEYVTWQSAYMVDRIFHHVSATKEIAHGIELFSKFECSLQIKEAVRLWRLYG